jgi:arylsulfatase A-like enzyme
MRILYLDCDTLRPDHLGCYGYHRNTSPNIDRIASEGVRFTNYYTSDAPCLPSRAALMNSRFGIHTGVVGHGGTAADLRLEGEARGFMNSPDYAPWMYRMVEAGYYTVSDSSFADRHSAWWFNHGFREMFNPGKRGHDIGHEVAPWAIDWIERNGKNDHWFLQVNFWDPHTPYRTPKEYGNPFENDPPPAWHTEDVRQRNWDSRGPHSARCPRGYPWEAEQQRERYPDIPDAIRSLDEYKRWVDGYDIGIHYMDHLIGDILDVLERQGVLDETAIIVSADHGENQGELNVYGDHQTADHITSCVPLIIRWPGVSPQAAECDALLCNVDLAPTVLDLVGGEAVPKWDGVSFAPAVRGESCQGRDFLVLGQCCWCCQRSVRWKNWILLRTFHDAYHGYPDVMLFDLDQDPHELDDLAEKRPEVVNEGLALLERWTTEMMMTSDCAEDPLWRVMREGGPLHSRGAMERFCECLRREGRGHHAEDIEARHGSRD